MFDHKHYVPILKGKGGEFWALSKLKAASKLLVTPVIELVPHDKKNTFEADLAKKLISLNESWPEQFFFDVRFAAPKNELPTSSTLSAAFRRMRAHGMKAIPVTRLGYSPKFQETIRAIAEQDQSGVMIRLAVADLAIREKLKTALSNLCNFLGVSEGQVDLLVDYGFKHPDDYEDLLYLQGLHLSKIPKIREWRTLSKRSAKDAVRLISVH